MVQGRGISATMVVLCMLGVFSEMAHATTYVVGGHTGGWAFNMTGWPTGKNFKAGDILVFNYNPQYHNVVTVDETGYNSCTAAPGSKTYQSGHDSITLAKGTTYFICTFFGHCEAKMKIAATAA
ncbi:basic blue protein-like [Vigna radiata var. radiata]|uniref:Basic blue protein n=1 Tax=Vigna radiata var. radiata TaxID=3916 RepID=A0A1S3VGL6_VIGRR|nr:basic blue protein-like [Vigna radiata var. radiata]